MKVVILTGMSGAGKSTALKMMEGIGFYCVDNLPIPLIEKFVELSETSTDEIQKFAIGVDIRSGNSFAVLRGVLVIYAGDSVYSAKYPNTGIGITECYANEKIDYCSIMPIIKN